MAADYVQNASNSVQLARMKKLDEMGLCLFCGDNYQLVDGSVPLHETTYWRVRQSDFPYAGADKHYLIVPKKHLSSSDDLSGGAWCELQAVIRWTRRYVQAEGWSLFVREGHPLYTGGSQEHWHLHVVTGGPKPADWTLQNAGQKCLPITLGYRKERKE